MYDSGTARLLLVGDDESEDRLLRRLLIEAQRPEWRYSWVRSPDAALSKLMQDGCEVVLVSEHLGRQSGLELVRHALERGARSAFILLAAACDRKKQEEAERAGALEALPKDELTGALFYRVVRSVVTHQRLQEELRESEERFRTLAAAAPVPLYVKGPDGRGIFFNQSWIDFRGRGMVQECGDGWQEGLHPEDRARILAYLHNAAHQRAPFEIEYRMRRRDGEYSRMLDVSKPRFAANGRFVGHVGTLTEVSVQSQLEHDVALAREQAVSASRLKSQFLANISHEIRTPMNGIIGMAGLLLDTPLNPEQHELAEAVQKSADVLLGVVNDILDIAKIETGRLQVDAVELELRSLIEDTVALLGERAQDKGLELVCEIEHEMPTLLRGDPGRLRQVLTNLVGNAVKFTEEGEVLVSATRVEETESVLVFRVEVKDTGIGITSEAQKLLFQPFVQADGSPTRRHGGMGLGLAISRQLIELMGGRMGVESEPEKGSVFWFELSLPKLVGGCSIPTLERLPHEPSVLVVNTSATNRRVLLNQLAELGVMAEAAGGAAEAFSLLRMRAKAGHPFDMALVDRMLPGTSSRQLAREIRADSALCGTALILSTSASHLVELQGFKQSGFDAFLLKPIRQRQLRQCLLRLQAKPAQRRTFDRKTERRSAHPFDSGMSPTRRGGLKILIVEDNYVNQKVAQRHVERLGHLSEAAENGAQALDMLALQKFDVVFMDCLMPVLDGYEATRRIRAGRVPNLDPKLPIIAFTSYSTEHDRQKCQAAGMDDVVAKPVRLEDIQAVLERRVVKEGDRHVMSSDSQPPFEKDVAVLDRSRLDHLYGEQNADEDFVRTLIDLFLAETPRRMDEIREARMRGDYRTLAHLAHTVQGAAANLGARSLEQLYQRIGDTALAGKQTETDILIGTLDEELARFASALDKQVRKAPIENPHG